MKVARSWKRNSFKKFIYETLSIAGYCSNKEDYMAPPEKVFYVKTKSFNNVPDQNEFEELEAINHFYQKTGFLRDDGYFTDSFTEASEFTESEATKIVNELNRKFPFFYYKFKFEVFSASRPPVDGFCVTIVDEKIKSFYSDGVVNWTEDIDFAKKFSSKDDASEIVNKYRTRYPQIKIEPMRKENW